MSKALDVVIVEDQPLYRHLLTGCLQSYPGVNVVGALATGKEALAFLKRISPDVALLDIDLGSGPNGVQTGLQARHSHPRMGIVLLSHYDQPGIMELIPRGQISGWCYLLKGSVSDVHVIERTIKAAARGLTVLDPALVQAYQSTSSPSWQAFTPRQQDILALIAQGYSNFAIGEMLGLRVKSVENHITQLYQVLNIASNADGLHPRVSATLAYLKALRQYS